MPDTLLRGIQRPRHRSPIGLLLAAIVGVGLLLSLVSSRSVAAVDNQPIPVSGPGQIVAEFSAATSPFDPNVMVASAIVGNMGAEAHCAVFTSSNGGSGWHETLAWPQDHGLAPVGDPWVAIGADGVLHATCIAPTAVGSRVVYTQSRDNGNTWSSPSRVTPVIVSRARIHSDKDALAVGADGTIYVCFGQTADLSSPAELVMSRSSDNGRTWTAVDTGTRGLCNGIALEPDGGITVLYIDVETIRFATVTSPDGGDHWLPSDVFAEPSLEDFQMPAMTSDGAGGTSIAAVAGGATPGLRTWLRSPDKPTVERWLDPPPSRACADGRLIQPALTTGPAGYPFLQIACKIDPTRDGGGRQEVWLYPDIRFGQRCTDRSRRI